MTATDFNLMILRYEEQLHPFAISLTKNTDDAQDLYQETMLRALLNKEKYEFGTNLRAWLYTIMRNIFINNYRRTKKFLTNNYEQTEELTFQTGLTSQNSGWNQLRMGEIRAAIDDLPQIFRLSFELYYTGYKYSEIASLLNEPLGTIKSRIHFARKMLVVQLDR